MRTNPEYTYGVTPQRFNSISRFQKYVKFRQSNLRLPNSIISEQDAIKCCIIVGEMFNSSVANICNFVFRKTNISITRDQLEEHVNFVLKLLRRDN